MRFKSIGFAFILAFSAGLFGGDAAAQSSHGRNGTIIVPSTAGSSGDLIARFIRDELAKNLGLTLVVENVPGASGAIGLQRLLQSDPANPALLVASPSETTVAPLSLKHPAFGSSDFRLIAPLSGQHLVMMVRPDIPAKNISELIDAAKRPGAKPLTLGGIGTGSLIQIAGADMSKRLDIPIIHVPYKGGPQAIQDAMSGQIDMIFLPFTPTFIQFVQTGKLKAFAVLGPKRHSVLTAIPSVDEVAGLNGMHYPVWQGLFVSSKVPRSTAVEINRAVNVVVRSPAYQDWLAQRGSSVESGMTADQAEAYFRDESRRLEAIAAQIGLPRE